MSSIQGLADRSVVRRQSPHLLVTAWVLMAGVLLGSPVGAECWPPPIDAPVADPFREPGCPYCAGNRGIEYAIGSPTIVRAVATGRAVYSGVVAGDRYVVVELANGWLLTYGRLASSPLRAGQVVIGGSVIGASSHTLFFGLRVDGEYRDPAPHLGRLVGRRRLIPTDGREPRPPPPPRLACSGGDAPDAR